MIRLIVIVAVMVAGLIFGPEASGNKGYVLISLGNYTVESSVTSAVILAVCLIVLNYGVAFVAARSPRARTFIEGKPVVLARDGKVFREVLKRELVSNADFLEAMRETGCSGIEHIRVATLETNGRISIVLSDDAPRSA